MVIAWIVITLLLAVVVGLIAAGVSDDGFIGFFAAFLVVCQISLFIAVVYVVGHFVSKYW